MLVHQLGHETGLVAKPRHVHVVMHRIGGDDEVGDVERRIERPCDTGVDHVGRAKAIDERLGDHRRVHLAHTAPNDDDRHSLDGPHMKL